MTHILTIYGPPLTRIEEGVCVHSSIYGEGVVDFINKNESSKLPLKIHFTEKKVYVFFDRHGKRWETDAVELRWSE